MKERIITLVAGLLMLFASTQAFALRCVASNGTAAITDTIPSNIAVPANAANGSLIWESSTRTIPIVCSHDWDTYSGEGVYLYVNPANSAPAAGTNVGIRWNGQIYTQSSGQIAINQSIPAGAGTTVSFNFTFSVAVLKKGTTPTSGISSFNNYRVFQMDGVGGLNATPNYNLNYIINGNVRFIGCFAGLSFSPSGTISMGTILAAGTAGQTAVERNFSLTANRTCDSPYKLNIALQPISSTPSGALSGTTMYVMDNKLGFSIIDPATNNPVPFDGTYSSFVDLTSSASATKNYRARLTRMSSKAVPGKFTISVVATLEYL